MAEWYVDGLGTVMSTTTRGSQTPVEDENSFIALPSKRSINKVLPEPVGPKKLKCASFLLMAPLSLEASSTPLRNSFSSASSLSSWQSPSSPSSASSPICSE